ncbi:clathrin light chain [Teratosphaeria destructans]|uniref:Clathrin light chain n=1 Tax=Teratosphaeria destructans TaxID=418781 RepID=A0A9W7SN75_9PEZI|nr:clathrin light chain [Teratosphaeria destructans]
MADRFPSLDDFEGGQTETQGTANLESVDEPSDFLAREAALLGDDAQQFATPADRAATVHEAGDDDDLLGGGAATNGANDDMMGDFESSFPAVSTQNEAVAPGGTITGSTLPYQPATHPAYSGPDAYEEEPEPVRQWRERRDADIARRDEISEGKKQETIKAAHQAIDEFYENYNNRKEKQIAQTAKEAEEFLKNREDTTSGGTSWERIAKLVDLSGKGAGGGAPGTGKAKMRELLISLRKDEHAPGATGV